MNQMTSVLKRLTSIITACFVGYMISLIPIDALSGQETIFFFASTLTFILTDFAFLQGIESKYNIFVEIILRISALVIPSIFISNIFSIHASIGICATYLLLGLYQKLFLIDINEEVSKRPLKEKAAILAMSLTFIFITFIFGLGIMSSIGFFNGFTEITNAPALLPGAVLTRILFVVQYFTLGIGYYFLFLKRKPANKYKIDFITGVHFLHILLSSVWAFTLRSLDSYLLAILSFIVMFSFLIWFITLSNKLTKKGIYFTLPGIMIKSINFYMIVASIILNPDKWDLI